MRRASKTQLQALRASFAVVAVIALAVVASGCEVGIGETPETNLVEGKKLFVEGCGACHVLARAGTKGVVGPNLDDAFRQSRVDGFGPNTVEGVVYEQILYPGNYPDQPAVQMPAKIFEGQQARNVAAYVAHVAGVKGEDKGALAEAIPAAGSSKPAVAKNGSLEIDANPDGQLRYVTDKASATPGKLLLKSKNDAKIDHNIAIEKVGQPGKVVKDGGTSETNVTLDKGTFTYYCTVPGHLEAGMKGTLQVK